MYDIKDIEDGFLAALGQLVTAGAVRTLESYGGQLDEERLEKETLRWPAVYVIWGGSEAKETNRMDALQARVSVIFCDRSLRGEAAARRGAAETSGLYSIMGQARGLLHRKRVLQGWAPASLEREGPLAYTREQGIAIYEQLYVLRTKVL